ncbi:LysR substrate-binding domain-containing protein [Modestobacter sp. DSM 44400]|uniref:LysR substrate-binding domain-containing protein n=1 Tax=Modestobacter sp. DSM 44400 TaxID=1550230 RepID=UPI001C312DBF|nr:LysR substrate-binding domain-containing protein [Modestobacter sp. DSM 44400]
MASVDAVTAEAARWNASGDEVIRMGVSPLIDSKLVAATYDAVCCLSALSGPRQLVLREANMGNLRDALVAGNLDLILIPSVGPLPRFEHRIFASEPMVVVESRTTETEPLQLEGMHDKELILMSDTCGLTTFDQDLMLTHDLKVRPYPGEVSSYRVLEEWADLGLGSALVPLSKLTSVDTPPAAARGQSRGRDLLRGRVGPQLAARKRSGNPREPPGGEQVAIDCRRPTGVAASGRPDSPASRQHSCLPVLMRRAIWPGCLGKPATAPAT